VLEDASPRERMRAMLETPRNSMVACFREMTSAGHFHLAVVGMLLSSFSPPGVASGQVRLGDQAVAIVKREVLEWSSVVAVDANDSLLVVMVDEEPVLHLFGITDGAHLVSWGRTGEGPGEFQSSAGVALVGDRVYALDTTQRRLSIFTQMGVHVETVLLDDLDFPFANKLYRASGDTVLIGAFEPMGHGRAVIAWTVSGLARNVLTYQDGTTDHRIRLEAPGAPSFTVLSPFRARPRWAADPFSGNVLYWPGHGKDIQVIGLDGIARDPVTLVLDDRFEVTSQDREHWIATAIPSEFRGQRVFEPLRPVAREIVEFPGDHALFYEMMAGPANTVWLRRNPNGRAQVVWDVWDAAIGQPTNRVMLREGLRLLALHNNYGILVNSEDASQEAVEVRLISGIGGVD